MDIIEGKTILITGASGTIGNQLISYLHNCTKRPKKIIGLDNNENNVFFQSIGGETASCDLRLCDIRNFDELAEHFKNVDIVFHAAALKHVIVCEKSPEQAVLTNIIGIQNVIRASNLNGVERVIFTSSDKAVNPTNVMGASKLMGERLISAANTSSKKTKFSSVRFGNVLGSNGSVVPIFFKQIMEGMPITITHPQMTRFVMSKLEAAKLVVKAAALMHGGEVFITKMPVINIETLADAMIEELSEMHSIDISSLSKKYIGEKAGEKMYEELMNTEEIRRSWELEDYFVILPAFEAKNGLKRFEYTNLSTKTVKKPYNSSNETPKSKQEVKDYLRMINLFSS